MQICCFFSLFSTKYNNKASFRLHWFIRWINVTLMYMFLCLWALTPAFVAACLITTHNLLEGFIHVLTFSWTFQLGITRTIQARCVCHNFFFAVEVSKLIYLYETCSTFRHRWLPIVGDQTLNYIRSQYLWPIFTTYRPIVTKKKSDTNAFSKAISKPQSYGNHINKRSNESHKRANIWNFWFKKKIKMHVVECEVAAGQNNKFRLPSTLIITQASDNSETLHKQTQNHRFESEAKPDKYFNIEIHIRINYKCWISWCCHCYAIRKLRQSTNKYVIW